MADSTALEVGNEGELWNLLERLLESPAIEEEVHSIRIVGWNPKLLYFPDEKIGHTIRPAVARALNDYHRSLQRAYALMLYGQANATFLTASDKDRLNIPFLIIDGSSGSEIIDNIVDTIVEGLFKEMTGTQKLIAIVLFILMFFGQGAALDWFEKNHNEKLAELASEERIKTSKHETERMKLLAAALVKTDVGDELQAESDNGRRALVKPATQQRRAVVMGVEVTGEQAKKSLSSLPKETKGLRIEGVFKVSIINTTSDDGFLLRLEKKDTGEVIMANANQSELADEDIHRIFDTAEKKSYFTGFVNAFYVGDKLTRAYLMRADAYKGQ